MNIIEIISFYVDPLGCLGGHHENNDEGQTGICMDAVPAVVQFSQSCSAMS
jgi:hypothetical protein